ncbi:DoxX family membrane protein [Clostridium sp. 19966]|uniref:DoxX family membrane protein n=1 Tax=Clostridium sp. 19966 TaxID=2768166 RepID=UPI0028DFB7A7|nr:DoxX family membrane protein [Clostridium sp. 19966]MDT8718620.1 DoxX family membrane protein [Clostridium sp. 19966]
MKFFKNKYFSIVWTFLRVWLGIQWIVPAIEKLKDPTWIGSKSGVAITGFLKSAVAKSTGQHPSVQGWYASFVQNVALPNTKVFTYLVPFGELLVGISLIFGAATIIGLFAGAFMNLNYMLAGTTSTNPILYTVAIILIVVGENSYIIGLDRFIVPFLKQKFKKRFV